MTQTDTRDPDEIEMEIRRTQKDMSRTVDRIGDQMTPRNLLNSLLDKADENGVDARFLLDGARRNPLALALISAGAIWLVSDYDAKPSAFTSNDGNDSDTGYNPHYDYDPDHRGYIEHMSRVERLPSEDEVTYQRRRDEARGGSREGGEDAGGKAARAGEAAAAEGRGGGGGGCGAQVARGAARVG